MASTARRGYRGKTIVVVGAALLVAAIVAGAALGIVGVTLGLLLGAVGVAVVLLGAGRIRAEREDD